MMLRRLASVLCVLALCACFISVVESQDNVEKARQAALAKRKWMLSKAKDAEDGIISLNSIQFNKYVMNSPRSYSVVVYFTASDPKFNCQPCKEIKQLLSGIGKAFKPSLDESQKKLVFFVEMDYSPTTGETFQGLQMQQVPQLVIVDPTKKRLQLSNFFETLGAEGKFTFDQQFSPRALVDWISQRSGVRAPEGGGHFEGGGGGGGGGGQIGGGPVSGAGYLLSLLIVGIPVFYVQRRNPIVYFVIATLAFFFCISGGMFNIIRQVPFAEVDRNGKTQYFSGGGQFQFASEGYIMGGLQIVGGLVMVLMNTVGVKATDGYRRHVLSIAFAVALYLLFAKIRELYMIKMPGYNHGHVWSWTRLLD